MTLGQQNAKKKFDLEMVGAIKGFKVIHLNVRSLLPKWAELSETILKSNFDVIIFTETWLHENINSSLIHSDEYMLFRLDRQTKIPSGLTKKGGGVCILVRKGISIELTDCINISNENVEMLHLNIKKGMAARLNIIGVYRPPTGNLEGAIEEMDIAVKSIRNNSKGEVVCMGDLNIDVLKKDKAATTLANWSGPC